MTKAIIVEDEVITRNGLMKHIPWGELGIDRVEAAENAEEALKICEDYQPDLIVSDIRMRGMNGVTMCRELRKKYPECQLIYISGYSDKEYLKAAIELGAVNYVEKPISPLELIDSIKKASDGIRKIQEQRDVRIHFSDNLANIRSKLLHSLIMEDDSDENLENNIAISGLFPADKNNMRICLIHTSASITNFRKLKKELEMRFNQICGRFHTEFYLRMLDSTNIILLLSGSGKHLDKKSLFLEEVQKYITAFVFETAVCYLAIGKISHTPKELSSSYRSALQALQCLSYYGYGYSAYSDEPFIDGHYEINEAIFDHFSEALSNGDQKEIELILKEISLRLKTDRVILNPSVRNIFYRLENIICRYENRKFSLAEEEQECSREYSSRQFDHAMTISDLTRYIEEHSREVVQKSQTMVRNNSAVCQVLELIQKDYRDLNLSVNSLAEEVFLTPTYLSTLFKKEIGVTIGQYLINFRIEKAKQLLKDKRYKLYQISSLVGYQDSNYFSKIFKRQVGMLPSEYREKYLK